MARVNTLGLEKEIRSLNLLSKGVKPTVEEMLENGAAFISKETQRAAEKHDLRDTGKMIKSIKSGNMRIDTDGGSIDVWPQGKRRKGDRNAVVGFVQHYGRQYRKKPKNGGGVTIRPGTGFFDEGFEASTDNVTALWEDMIDELIKQRG